MRLIGEVITHVNGRAVTSPAAFYRETLRRTGRVELTLLPGDPTRPARRPTASGRRG